MKGYDSGLRFTGLFYGSGLTRFAIMVLMNGFGNHACDVRASACVLTLKPTPENPHPKP